MLSPRWCAALAYAACSATLVLGAVHGAEPGGTNLRKLFAESHHHDHPHAPEHVGDETTRRKADENMPHTYDSVWEILQTNAKEHAPDSRLLEEGASSQPLDSKEYLKFVSHGSNRPHGDEHHYDLLWCGVPIHGAYFTARTDSFHHIQELEGWVLDDPVALGLPNKDFFGDRLKMEAERFTTDDASRAFRTFVKDAHARNERDTLVVASVAELVLYPGEKNGGNQAQAQLAFRAEVQHSDGEHGTMVISAKEPFEELLFDVDHLVDTSARSRGEL